MAEQTPNLLRSALADQLDKVPIAQVVEYLAHRLLDGGQSTWSLRFELQEGKLRRAEIVHGQIGVTEIEKMGGRSGA